MVEQIVVVGSGVMGRGIAYVAAHRGFQVTLVDIKEAYVESAYQELERIAEKGIARGKMSASEVEGLFDRLSLSTDLATAAQQADLVIEAVPEQLSIKQLFYEPGGPGHGDAFLQSGSFDATDRARSWS